MKTEILLFARARDLVGRHTVTLDLEDGATVGQAAAALAEQFPALRDSGLRLLWAVNEDYVTPETPIREQDTVACFPPVSGG